MHREQVRAHNAFQSVQGVTQKKDELLALARKLPVMFQTNGLLATWAHLLAKSKEGSEHVQVLAALASHFRSLALAGEGAPGELFNSWVSTQEGLSSQGLRRCTTEAIEFAVWLKRAAEALCDTGNAGGVPASPGPGETRP
jgi:CRISPR/Cas system CMR-associated protein Cmr5 small subunit